MKQKKLKLRVLKDNEIISYVPITEDYGRAEFCICPVFKRGKLKQVFIYPSQQKDVKYYYRLDLTYNPDTFTFGSWTHKGIEEPHIRVHYWCREHKCLGFRIYVPLKTNSLVITKGSNLDFRFEGDK